VVNPEDYRSIVFRREDTNNLMVMMPSDVGVSAEMPILQALTCPLGYLSSALSELLLTVQDSSAAGTST